MSTLGVTLDETSALCFNALVGGEALRHLKGENMANVEIFSEDGGEMVLVVSLDAAYGPYLSGVLALDPDCEATDADKKMVGRRVYVDVAAVARIATELRVVGD